MTDMTINWQVTRFSEHLYTAVEEFMWMDVNKLIMGVHSPNPVDKVGVKTKLSTYYPQGF